MSRWLAIVVAGFAAAPACAVEPPEHLLPPTAQVYVRWDGVAPHAAAYRASVWGGLMAGPTGDAVRTLLANAPRAVGSSLLGGPLLEGRPLDELKAIHAELKAMGDAPQLLADHGVVFALDVRPPRVNSGGVTKLIGGLLGRDPNEGKAAPDVVTGPEVRAFVVVPDAAPRADALFAALKTLARKYAVALAPLPGAGRVGHVAVFDKGVPISAAVWVEGPHVVLYAGTVPFEQALKETRANAAAGGVTAHPLFKRAAGLGRFESVARGYVDAAALISPAKALLGPFVPGLAARVDGTGLGNLSAVVFASGFDGKEARAAYEIDLPGERKGLAKVFKRGPLGTDDLPPLPPDCSRFSALRVDWNAVYDGGMSLVEAASAGETFGVEDGAGADVAGARRTYLKQELDKRLGVAVADDLLPHLGDVVVAYQSPSEGLQLFGQCFAVKCKDPAAVRLAADRVQRMVDSLSGGKMKVRKKQYAGVELREVYGRDFGVLTPTYAVVGDWLVMGGHPQLVQGFILRHNGTLPSWKPDAATAARIGKLPADRVGLQYCSPMSTATNLCCVGPTFLAAVTRFGRSNEYDPPDLGLIPNVHELGRHLFPNLVATTDDGTTVRLAVNESFSLPLDAIGFDFFLFAGLQAGF